MKKKKSVAPEARNWLCTCARIITGYNTFSLLSRQDRERGLWGWYSVRKRLNLGDGYELQQKVCFCDNFSYIHIGSRGGWCLSREFDNWMVFQVRPSAKKLLIFLNSIGMPNMTGFSITQDALSRHRLCDWFASCWSTGYSACALSASLVQLSFDPLLVC